MNEILLIAYIVENIYLVYRYYKKDRGIFTPVFIIAVMSLGQILPQLTTIFFLDRVYPPVIIPNLLFTMITCNAAFCLGWENMCNNKKTPKTKTHKIRILDINRHWYIFLTITFSVCAYIFTYIIKAESEVIDGVIAFQFQGLGVLGIILAILYLERHKISWIIIACLITASYPILEYALDIYGSRQSIFTLLLLYSYLATIKFPHKYNLIKRIFLITFIAGCIGSLSIVEVRTNIHEEKGIDEMREINFTQNAKDAFTNSYSEKAGMDLGNAALAIEKVYREDRYNYGLFAWNGFIFNYVPRRLVGQEIKNKLMYNDGMSEYIDFLANGTTCTTGYYDAFSAFGILGFMTFFLLAWLFKYIYSLSEFSTLYKMLFLFTLSNSSVALTHSLQLALQKIEFVILLFIVLWFTLIRKQYSFSMQYHHASEL